MMARSTETTPPTLDDAVADVEAKRKRHSEMRAAIVAGDLDVTATDLRAAADELEHAELVLELAEASDKRKAAERRDQRIDELVASVDDVDRAREVLDAAERAKAALQSLREAVDADGEAVTAVNAELRRLSKQEDDAQLANLSDDDQRNAAMRPRGSRIRTWTGSVAVDGRRLPAPTRAAPLADAFRAVDEVTRRHRQLVGDHDES